MKSHLLMFIGSILILTTLKPVRCQAQAEVAPDHYNETGIEPVTLPGNVIPANRKAENVRGSFILPFDVKCAGFTLSPGKYSLLVRELGKGGIVTLVPQGSPTRIQVRMKFRSGADGRSALLLQHNGQQRTLTAISLKEPRKVLYLEAEQTRSILEDTELVPISYAIRKAAGN